MIGDASNSKSSIQDAVNGTKKVEVDTPDILDGQEMRAFWVYWWGGVIEVGTGSFPGFQGFMRWKDPMPHDVTNIGLCTGGTEGTWEIVAPYGKISFKKCLRKSL